MKKIHRSSLALMCCCCLFCLTVLGQLTADAAKPRSSDMIGNVNASFDVDKMGDMSGFDPSNPVVPTGDTIKIGIVLPFTGPAAVVGDSYYLYLQWAAHDFNKRGGILVDGKKKLIEVIKGDHMSRLDTCKKVSERLALQDKVHILVGGDSTPNMKVLQDTADKYKIIAVNIGALSDDIMSAETFNRYSFQTVYDTSQIGRSLAYYYGQIRKKEKKFYILCQDYSYGHSVAEAFKSGLKEYYPSAEIVGEDYHKLFLTDFAPYLTKIKTSKAEVIVTGDWIPDLSNLVKQTRQYGITIPIAGKDMDNPPMLLDLGVDFSKNMVSLGDYNGTNPVFKTAQQKKYHDLWHNLWKTKWTKPPYNSKLYIYGEQITGRTVMPIYWLMSVIERAGSTDPEKIIKVWENDRFRTLSGKILTMRSCDHKVIQDMAVIELVPPDQQKVSYNIPPYHWFKECSFTGPVSVIPQAKILPWMDQKLERCRGKNGWGK
ncbi:MAG: ABC transporter substrate-binding protein [Deltaproteobacteria bacterium]